MYIPAPIRVQLASQALLPHFLTIVLALILQNKYMAEDLEEVDGVTAVSKRLVQFTHVSSNTPDVTL
jgi:hypothetical protein